MPSKRALLALGGIAAVAGGVLASTDTLAASTDAATATANQIASENFFPTPLPSSISCSETGTAGFKKANVSWPSAGAGMRYRVVLWTNNMAGVERGAVIQTGTSWTLDVNYNIANGNYVLSVQTMNTASGDTDQTRPYSSGYRRITVGSNGQRNGTCQGGAGVQANATWEDGSEWNPAAPLMRGRSVLAPEAASQQVPTSTTAPSSSETAKPSASQEPQPSTSTTPSAEPSAEPSTETTPPSTSTAAPAKITFGVELNGDERSVVILHDGEKACAAPLKEGFSPSSNGTDVVVSDGKSVFKVDPNTCALS